jgi:hypothetical protein
LTGFFAGHRQDLRHFFGCEFARRTSSGRVVENVLDGSPECGLRFATFDCHQRVEGRLPTTPPQTDLLSVQTNFFADLYIELAGECQ